MFRTISSYITSIIINIKENALEYIYNYTIKKIESSEMAYNIDINFKRINEIEKIVNELDLILYNEVMLRENLEEKVEKSITKSKKSNNDGLRLKSYRKKNRFNPIDYKLKKNIKREVLAMAASI